MIASVPGTSLLLFTSPKSLLMSVNRGRFDRLCMCSRSFFFNLFSFFFIRAIYNLSDASGLTQGVTSLNLIRMSNEIISRTFEDQQ